MPGAKPGRQLQRRSKECRMPHHRFGLQWCASCALVVVLVIWAVAHESQSRPSGMRADAWAINRPLADVEARFGPGGPSNFDHWGNGAWDREYAIGNSWRSGWTMTKFLVVRTDPSSIVVDAQVFEND